MDKEHNINLKVENKEVAQFTTPAKIQEWVRAVMSVLGMIVAVIVVGTIIAGIAFLGWAFYQDSQVQPQPVQKSAKNQQARPTPVAPQAAPQKPAVDLSQWRQVVKGMNHEQVHNLLGEPVSVRGGDFTVWSYAGNGSVTFYKDVVYMWQEPR